MDAGEAHETTKAALAEGYRHIDTVQAYESEAEMHPVIDQTRLRSFMQDAGIPLTAYAPLAQGRVMQGDTMAGIAEAHGTSAVAWLRSRPGMIALRKTAKASRRADNLRAADEIARIDAPAGPDGRIVAPETLAPDRDD